MELGRIKWAGHYNSQTGDYNNYGFITRIPSGDDLYFHKDAVLRDSKLLVHFNDSDDHYVVFDVSQSPKKRGQFNATNVQYLDEVSAELLLNSLSEESRTSATVQRILLDICPEALLGNKPENYFPLLDNTKVKILFVEKLESDQFEASVVAALIQYFGTQKHITWNNKNWKLIDWSKESTENLRKLCYSAIEAHVDCSPLCRMRPSLWREDPTFAIALPAETIRSIITDDEYTFNQADFEYLMACLQDSSIKSFLCDRAGYDWFLSQPDYITYLADDRLSYILAKINWDSTSQSYIDKATPFINRIQRIADTRIEKIIVSAVEKAWIIEDSPWWPVLSESIKNIVLRDYREAGLITESNATINPALDKFLNQYYQGDQKRDFSVQQKEAIQAVKGVTLLFAVPGSGKTTVIVARAGYMAHAMRIAPKSHLVMTFSSAAADEMEKRYKEIYSVDGKNIPDFRTIHSFCYSVIKSLRSKGEPFPLLLKGSEVDNDPQEKQKRESEIAAAICGVDSNNADLPLVIDYVNAIRERRISGEQAKHITCFHGMTLDRIYAAWERKDVTRKAVLRKVMNTEAYDEDANTLIDTICTLIGFIKNRMLSPDEIKQITYKVKKQDYPIEPIYTAYQQYLRQENLMDFDDMLFRAYSGLKKYPDILSNYQDKYPYVSLDEAQDTSLLQHEIVALLVTKYGNLFMVGDDDQSIYAFRGAVPSEMLDFRKRYQNGQKLLMGTNYRSDIDIVRSADRFVQVNQKRENKLMRPSSQKPGNLKIVLIPNLSAQYEYITNAALTCLRSHDKKEDLAILFRWNISALPVMAYFYQNHIPFACSKQREAIDSVLTKREVKRIINMLRYSRHPEDFCIHEISIEMQKRNYREKIRANPKWRYCGLYVEIYQPTTIQLNTRVHPDCTPPCAQGALVAFSGSAPCSFFAISDST